MVDAASGIQVNCMQQVRIAEHPIQINDSLIILDDLEAGTLRIYEYLGGPLNIQQLFSKFGGNKNITLVAEGVINSLWRNDGIFIHKISYGNGYEFLAEPVLSQILHFAGFYNYRTVGISDREYENLSPDAGEILSDFKKSNRVYEYCL